MTTLEAVRDELVERRERLASLAVTVRESQLVELLRHVDSALERPDGGTWGRCGAFRPALRYDAAQGVLPMESQLTVRIPLSLADKLEQGDLVRTRPYDRVRELLGSIESGIPDLGQNHRKHLLQRLKGARPA